jgi:hypothetical protein
LYWINNDFQLSLLCQLDVAYSSMVLELQHDLEQMVTRALVSMERSKQAAVDDLDWTLLQAADCADEIDSTGEVSTGSEGEGAVGGTMSDVMCCDVLCEWCRDTVVTI